MKNIEDAIKAIEMYNMICEMEIYEDIDMIHNLDEESMKNTKEKSKMMISKNLGIKVI